MGTLAEGIKEIFATAKATGSNVMLCGNDGTPDGHITMYNLASVLGANKRFPSMEIDFNDYTNNGHWAAQRSTSYSNAPTTSFAGALYVENANDDDVNGVSQYAYNVDLGKLYYRFKWTGSWGNWQEITADLPAFYKNYSDLSSLANALGALYHMFNYTYEIQAGEQQLIENTYLGAVIFCTSINSGKTYIMQIPYYAVFEEIYGEEFKVKRTSNGSSAVIENMSGNTTTVKLIVFGMDL